MSIYSAKHISRKLFLFFALTTSANEVIAFSFNSETTTRERLQIEYVCEQYTLDVMSLYQSYFDGKSEEYRDRVVRFWVSEKRYRSFEDLQAIAGAAIRLYERDRKKLENKKKKMKSYYSSTYNELEKSCMKHMEDNLYE